MSAAVALPLVMYMPCRWVPLVFSPLMLVAFAGGLLFYVDFYRDIKAYERDRLPAQQDREIPPIRH